MINSTHLGRVCSQDQDISWFVNGVLMSVLRNLCCRAWSSSRAAWRGSSGWGALCRTTIRPSKSPRGQVQPDPWLKATQLPLLTSTHVWTSFSFKQESPAHLSVPQESSDAQQTPVSSTPPSALFWYLFFENCFVLFLLFVYFDRSTLCISMYMVQSLPLPLKCIRPAR